MTEYTITIDGYESDLTEKTIEREFRERLVGQDVNISVHDEESNIFVERHPPYVNIFSDGHLIVSISEQHDEALVYQSGTDEPINRYTLSNLRNGLALDLD